MTPGSVREAVHRGHEVVVETNAAHVIGLEDEHYRQAGATIADNAAEVWATADMIVKVKEPQASEYPMIRRGPSPVHLPASRAGSCTNQSLDGVRVGGHCLRNGHGPARRAAAPDADERRGGPHVGPGRCAIALRSKWGAAASY